MQRKESTRAHISKYVPGRPPLASVTVSSPGMGSSVHVTRLLLHARLHAGSDEVSMTQSCLGMRPRGMYAARCSSGMLETHSVVRTEC